MVFKDILRQRARKSTTVKALQKYSPYQILWKPIVTEKAYKQIESTNIYTFRVHSEATKTDVKASLLVVYGVQPLSLRLVSVPYKWRSQRKLVRRAYKKVFVTLPEWQKIDLAW
jgi:large subunit ribosomal protein L23